MPCVVATAEGSSDGRRNSLWQQAGRHQTIRGKYADENSKQSAQGSRIQVVILSDLQEI